MRKLVLLVFGIVVFNTGCSNESLDEHYSIKTSDEILKTTYKSTVEVVNPIYGTQPGTSTLHRNSNGLTVNYKTSGLNPGYAYTMWWVIWNDPENCGIPKQCNDSDFAIADQVNVDVLYAAGHVVGNNGVGNFSSRLNAGDDARSINDIFGLPAAGGLRVGNTFGAEVHLVLRSHGPAVPGIINEQINSYGGGCEIELIAFVEDPDEIGECSDVEFAIHPPVN